MSNDQLIITCENVCKCISSCDLESRVFGSKHIQEECSQTAQDAQETKGGDHPQQQDGLRVHTVIWRDTVTTQSITTRSQIQLWFIAAFKRPGVDSHRPAAWGQCTPRHLPPPALVSDRCLREPAAMPAPPERCTARWWTELRAGRTSGSAPAAWAGRCPLSSSGLQERSNPAGRTWSSNLCCCSIAMNVSSQY